MSDTVANTIFKTSSMTYFTASLFFPRAIRREVTDLYAFVRLADNFVDTIPQDESGFNRFEKTFWLALNGEKRALSGSEGEVIARFVQLTKKWSFEPDWIQAFFAAMRADLKKTKYQTIEETIEYMYGSAEVIGLMLSAIFELPDAAAHSARMLGRSMQYANMIRDVNQDQVLGRQYLPTDSMQQFGLQNLCESEAREKPEQFAQFMRVQIEQYYLWQAEAEEGYHWLPKRIRVPVMTAGEMYTWTMREIEKNPLLVFEKQLKPSRQRVVLTAMRHLFSVNQ